MVNVRNKYYILLVVAISLLLLPPALTEDPSTKVSLTMDFNINGIANDNAEVDGNSIGVYYPGDIDNYYVCLEDNAYSSVFGIASSEIDYIQLSKPANYSIKISQNYTGNSFIIPVTIGSCNFIKSNMPSIKSSQFLGDYASFIARPVDMTYLILNYSVDIIGDFSQRGSFILTMRNNNSQLIMGLR